MSNIFDRKQNIFKSPDLTKLQLAVIDQKTNIYIALDADPDEARSPYFNRLKPRKKLHSIFIAYKIFPGRKVISSGFDFENSSAEKIKISVPYLRISESDSWCTTTL